jgi:hypothetical protein
VFSGNRDEVEGSGGLSGGTFYMVDIWVRVGSGGSCGSRSFNTVSAVEKDQKV